MLRRGRTATRYGNKNAVKHGGYMNLHRPDQRTREAKILNEIEARIVSAVGGDPSPQEILLIKRISVKGLRCAAIEREIVRQEGDVSPELEKRYLRWASELRMDLKLIGLDRKQKEVAKDLRSYISKEYS